MAGVHPSLDPSLAFSSLLCFCWALPLPCSPLPGCLITPLFPSLPWPVPGLLILLPESAGNR